MNVGMRPVSWFSERSNSSNNLNLPRDSGSLPVNLLPDKLNLFKLVILPKECAGNAPLKLLFLSSDTVSRFQHPQYAQSCSLRDQALKG
ncbi:hypothetical protein Tco_0790729 [Tanacetum coccineum]